METEDELLKSNLDFSLEAEEDSNTNASKTTSYINGRWTRKEHNLFLKGCLTYRNNWKKIESLVKTRTSSQIRSHAQKYLIKLNKKYKSTGTPFSHSEKYIKKYNSKIENQVPKEVKENLTESGETMEKIEKIILKMFFMETPQENQKFSQERVKDMIKNSELKKEKQKEYNDKEKEEKEKEKSKYLNDSDRRIFECEKIPKDTSVFSSINSKLNSCKKEDFYTLLSWLTLKNSSKGNLIKFILYKDYYSSLQNSHSFINDNYHIIMNNNNNNDNHCIYNQFCNQMNKG